MSPPSRVSAGIGALARRKSSFASSLYRLSRSLLDFARMMETFEKHKVSFVAVTQQFNTSTSMGRLVLNVLLSFAQFEREMISERTRDKIAAARRRGKWSGGMPLLGYNVVESKPVVDLDEAEQVRQIFGLYLEHEGLLHVVEELEARGWRTKRWTTGKGTVRERGVIGVPMPAQREQEVFRPALKPRFADVPKRSRRFCRAWSGHINPKNCDQERYRIDGPAPQHGQFDLTDDAALRAGNVPAGRGAAGFNLHGA